MVTRIQESVQPTRRIGAAVPFHASPRATRFATNRLTQGDGRFSFDDVLKGETFPEESFHPLLYGRVLRESRGGGTRPTAGTTAQRWLLFLTADLGQDVTEGPAGAVPELEASARRTPWGVPPASAATCAAGWGLRVRSPERSA